MAMLFAYCTFKPWNIRGGSQALSSALIDSFMRAGGEARFNCGAGKILTEGAARGRRAPGIGVKPLPAIA